MQNPFRQIKKYPELRTPRYVPTIEDFWCAYDKIEGNDPIAVQDRTVLVAFLHLAARRNEIFGLKIADLDFANSKVRLWTRKREGGDLEPDWLPMTQELKSVLLNWLEIRMQLPGIDKEHVFVCISDHPVAADFYGKPFKKRQHYMKKICKNAKVKPFGFHAIRHLTATILYHKGYKPAHIQAVLRHKSIKTTELYLQRLGLEMVRDVLEEGLHGPAKVIPFQNKLPSEGQL